MASQKSKSHTYTEESKIVTCIEHICSLDRKTIQKHLEFFKADIYYCSFNQENPMFHDATLKNTVLSTELAYIYELICNYFKSQNAFSFTLRTKTSPNNYIPDIKTLSKLLTFKWNVSDDDIPLLALYVCSTPLDTNSNIESSSNKKKQSVKKIRSASFFFKSLTKTLHSKIRVASDNNLDLQVSTFLNKKYFLSLEEIYKTFSKTPEQRQLIQEAIYPITRLCINAYSINDLPRLTAFSEAILADFKEQLSNYAETLYDYDTEFRPVRESQLIGYYFEKLDFSSQKLLASIQKNLDEHHLYQGYPLSIDNYDEFYKQSMETLQTICDCPKKFIDSLSAFFTALKKCPEIITAQKNHTLTYNFYNEEEHAAQLHPIFSKYAMEIEKDFNNFFEKMKKASDSTKYINTIPEPDDYLNLEKSISRTLKRLNDKLKKTTNNLPELMVQHHEGQLSSIGYSQCPLSSEKVFKILKLSFPKREFSSEILDMINHSQIYPYFLGTFLLYIDNLENTPPD